MSKKYRKKVLIEAEQFDGFESAQKIASEINGTVCLVAAPHPVIK